MTTSAQPDHEALERVRQTELLISNLLRGGVLLSIALIIFGTAITFIHHPGYLTDSAQLDGLRDGADGFPASFGGIVRGLGAFEGRAIVMLGLLVLIATPVMRVAVSILAFVHAGDRAFAIITAVVLALLLLALALGKAGG
ncbi:MAG: DUF1634 domain-containing protein [Dehalococcoidia bacterium]|nr:DUF1634 domain-containing protein [Dehalococcoidia bacterium]